MVHCWNRIRCDLPDCYAVQSILRVLSILSVKMKRKTVSRVLISILLPVGIILACYAALNPQYGIGCVFYRTTGLYCPGCGSGRAVSLTLHGDYQAAFFSNPLLFLLGGPSLLVFLHEYFRFLIPSLNMRPIYIGRTAIICCLVLIFAFGILRNIPAFYYLAP